VKKTGKKNGVFGIERAGSRAYCLREITVSYEGRDEYTLVRAPDLSAGGMFVSTGRTFPEGAVLNLRFRLLVTNAEVRTRCEVRYCLPGVGVGVQFIGLPSDATEAIEKELALW
jgi:hypothetical protein